METIQKTIERLEKERDALADEVVNLQNRNEQEVNFAVFVALQCIRIHDQPLIAREIVDADVGIKSLIEALDCRESVDVDTLKWLCHNEYRWALPLLRKRINKLRELEKKG